MISLNRALGLASLVLVLSGCGGASPSAPTAPGQQVAAETGAAGGSTSTSPPPTAAPVRAPIAAPPAPPVSATPVFVFEPRPLSVAARARMTGPAWRPGCPVGLDDLRTIRLTFWGFDGVEHEGMLVVHADAVATMRGVFAELYAVRWPIRQIRPIEEYGGDDEASMDADNTSAFSCRPSSGGTSTWSQHAYGRAIDINPRENPYVTSQGVQPKAGAAFLDRTQAQPGLIGPSSVVVRAFDQRGWGWGGRWSPSKDYQHFSANGR